jgi:hypothetical protein
MDIINLGTQTFVEGINNLDEIVGTYLQGGLFTAFSGLLTSSPPLLHHRFSLMETMPSISTI